MLNLLKKIFWFTVDVVEVAAEDEQEEATVHNESFETQYGDDGNYMTVSVHRDSNDNIID